MSRFVGLDVGGTHVRVAKALEAGVQSDVATHTLPAAYDAFVDAAAAWFGPEVEAVGVGLPGHVRENRPVWIPNVPWLDGRDLAGDLAHRSGARVTLANDGQCALLAELHDGAARDVGDVILVAIGTGIGGAVARGGRLVRGAHGTAGAFGWLPAPPPAADARRGASERGERPQHGAWERRASGSALRQRIESAGLGADALRTGLGDDARTLLDAYLDDVAVGLAALASIFDPARVLLSGGVAELLASRLDDLEARMRRYASPVEADTTLRIADHGAAAGARGALRLAILGEGAFLS
jgi:predicted NBD/HSP70 family sugar kinase